MKTKLTEQQRSQMFKSLQKLLQNDVLIVYCFVTKQSDSGFFSNQRLLLLNSLQKSIRYYNKDPDILPFTKLTDIPQGKKKVFIDKVNNFKCQQCKGKTSTAKVQWENNKNMETWIFTFANSKIMNQWLSAVEQLQTGKIISDPTYMPAPPPPQQPENKQQSKENIDQQNILSNVDIPESRFDPSYSKKQQKQQYSLQNQLTNQPMQSTILQPFQSPLTSPQQTGSNVYNQNDTNQYQNPHSNPKFGDIAQQINSLRKNGYRKFNLTNQLSIKNLPNTITQQQQPQSNNLDINTDNYIIEDQKKYQPPSEIDQHKPKQPPPEQCIKQPSSKMLSFTDDKNINKQQEKQPKIQQPPLQILQYQHQQLQPQFQKHQIQQQIQQQQQQTQSQKLKQTTKLPTLNYLNHFHSSQMDNLSDDQLQSLPHYKNKQMSRVHSQQPSYNAKQLNTNQIIRSQVGCNDRKQKKLYKKWNQIWCTTNNPLSIYQQFIKTCQKTSIDIINQLPFNKSRREYAPLKYKNPHFIYLDQGIIYHMHYFGQQSQLLPNNKNPYQRDVLLYDHQTYTQTKRQFYNHNFLLGATGNNGFIKIPLSCLIQYKGILIYCKAAPPDDFDQVTPQEFSQCFQRLQEEIGIPFVYNSMVVYVHPQKKYLIITELSQLIPRIPIDSHPPAYFRKQYLLTTNLTMKDQRSVRKMYKNIIDQNIKQFITRFETLQTWVINSRDFLTEMHQSGLSLAFLQLLYEQTRFVYFKKILVTEMVKGIFCNILRSELNYTSSSKQFTDNTTIQQINTILLNCFHILLNQLFSYSTHSQNIWRVIVKQVNKRYKLIISKEDIIPGYLLGGITQFMGLTCDFQTPNLHRKQPFFLNENAIPRDILLHFQPRVRRYDLDTVSPLVQRIQQLLQQQPTPQHYEELLRILDLRNRQIPSYLSPFKLQILTYLCNFIPLGEHEQFNHIGIYDTLSAEPHTYCSTKISLLAAKWATKKKNYQLANQIFEIKFEENSFWVSEFNPAISQFYDFFSLYNFSIGNYEQSVKLAKSSLVNSIKLTGANSVPVADKHYQLGNIYFKIGTKQQSLKQYHRTKHILQHHKQTTIPEYGVILLKLALLYLNFGKVSDCVSSSLQALKIFDNNNSNDQNKIETFQILSRSYQITRKNNELLNVSSLCMQKFNSTQNPKIFQKMIKIVILPKLISINGQDAKTLIKIFNKLEELQSSITFLDAFNYLHIKSQQQIIMKKIINFMENITNLSEDVMRKDLFRKHKCLNLDVHLEAAEMLVLFEAIANMVGFNFINGLLRENYY